MRLTEAEYYKYLEIHTSLIYYVGIERKLIPEETELEDFMKYSIQDKYAIRNVMYDNIHMLDDYINENSRFLPEEYKEIIRGFKHFNRGKFYVIKLTQKYAFFLGDKFVYGVYALSDPFQKFWGNNDLPVMVDAVLLPFKGKIIYDGMISNFPVRFGKGIRGTIKNDFNLAEGKYGVITELPVNIEESKLEVSYEKELLIMMKTKASRKQNYYEIEALLDAHSELEPVYIKEWGRINSRKKKKELREIGIKRRWFAIHNDTIVLSGQSEKELEKTIAELIPDKISRDGIYYFKI